MNSIIRSIVASIAASLFLGSALAQPAIGMQQATVGKRKAVGGVGANDLVAHPPPQPGSTQQLGAGPATLSPCAVGIEDQANPGAAGCLQASSQPALGKIYPLSANLFVSPIGRVGVGTTSPGARLHVAGTARMTDKLTLAPSGDQALDVSTGSIYKGGALFIHTLGGPGNTALGGEALASVTSAKVYALPNLDKTNLGKLIDIVSGIGLGSKEHKDKDKDTLGRVYEYFLSRFASTEGRGGGEFYTPTSVVRLLVEMLEPYEGRVYDPCCGSGGKHGGGTLTTGVSTV